MNSLRVPGFRRLVSAWVFSNFGDSVLYLTLAIWVKDITGSDGAAGLVFLFLGLPVFLSPLAGQLADHTSRKRLVIWSNLAAAIGVMALRAVEGPDQLWLIYLVTFGYGLLTYLTSAAGAGLVRDLLADDQLASGNGVLNTIDQGLRLLSPLVGAGAYALFGGFAIALVTSAMLATAAAVMTTLSVVETPPTAERQPFLAEFLAGARHIRSVPVLARVTISLGIAISVTGLANSAIFAVIEQGLQRPPEFFGVLAAMQGGGSVVGGLTAAAVIRRHRETPTIALALGLFGMGLFAAAVQNVVVVLAALGVVGLAVSWFIVAFVTLRQRLTPGRLQGRVQAAANMALTGPQTIGTAVGAALVTLLDYRVLIVAMGAVALACIPPIALVGDTDPPSADPA